MKRVLAAAAAVVVLLLATQLGASGARADVDPATIDFEGLAEGAIVSNVSCGSGITCTADPGGSVSVFGSNPAIGGGATNTAMVFDAECLPSGTSADCSGGDDDLLFPGQGNMLIISEDLNSSDPDDADNEDAFFTFDYTGWGPGSVCVDSITAGDVETVETGAQVTLFPSGTVVPIPDTGDNALVTVDLGGECGVTSMQVDLNGSGAIDNIGIELEEEPPDGEACTPGYWKNLRKHLDEWTAAGFSPGDDYEAIFGVDAPGTPTLGDAIDAKGGGENKLLRFSTAALLSAAHPDVNFALTEAEVIALTQDAFATGDFDAFDGFFDDEECFINNG